MRRQIEERDAQVDNAYGKDVQVMAIHNARRYLGDRFDPERLRHHRRLVDEEEAAAPDETTFYRTSEAYLYDLTVFAMSGTKAPYLDAVRRLTDAATAVADADIVVFAVPDLALGPVTADLVPQMKSGAIALTLDPAAAYAGLLTDREDVIRAVAHPCHPSIFLQRQSPEEWADTFGGIAASQDAIAAIESDDPANAAIVEATVRAIYAPVIDVHFFTIKQLAQLEPTLVETVAWAAGNGDRS